MVVQIMEQGEERKLLAMTVSTHQNSTNLGFENTVATLRGHQRWNLLQSLHEL